MISWNGARRIVMRRFQKSDTRCILTPMTGTTFREIKKDKNSAARVGIIETPFGAQMTPLYVFAGTNGYVRTLTPDHLREFSVGMLVANTFHLWQNPGAEEIKNRGGLHTYMDFKGLIMTDSGGFQVFSYGYSREHGVLKVGNVFPGEQKNKAQPHSGVNNVRVTEEGAYFELGDGKEHFLTPKKSIDIQQALGADIILAFDELTSPLHDYAYVKKSLARTHRWAKESLAAHKASPNASGGASQALFGIIQGSNFRNLREEAARFITSQPFDGVAIGGSLGDTKHEMHEILGWLTPILETRPNWQRHLLGIGQIDDIFEGVERGIDTFDCVIPTREARHGCAWTPYGRIDVAKGKFKDSKERIMEGCSCHACQNYTLGQLREMRKAKDPESGRLLTLHNITFFQELMFQIREAIMKDRFAEFKKEFLAGLHRKN